MGRIGDIETKSLSARVPMETYIHFLSSSSKNKQTISAYLCDVLINVSTNQKPQSFENGGVTREQLEYANKQAFKGVERLRGTIKDQELRLNKQSETIGQLRKKIADLEVENETSIHFNEENILLKNEMLMYVPNEDAKGNLVLKGDTKLMKEKIEDITKLLNFWLEKNGKKITLIPWVNKT